MKAIFIAFVWPDIVERRVHCLTGQTYFQLDYVLTIVIVMETIRLVIVMRRL